VNIVTALANGLEAAGIDVVATSSGLSYGWIDVDTEVVNVHFAIHYRYGDAVVNLTALDGSKLGPLEHHQLGHFDMNDPKSFDGLVEAMKWRP